MSFALVAKLVDAPDLGSGVAIRVGSSPIRRTFSTKNARINACVLVYYKPHSLLFVVAPPQAVVNSAIGAEECSVTLAVAAREGTIPVGTVGPIIDALTMGESVKSFTYIIIASLIVETKETTRIGCSFGGGERAGLNTKHDT